MSNFKDLEVQVILSIDNTDTWNRLCLSMSDTYTLVLEDDGINLKLGQKHLHNWPYRYIRNFGKSQACFAIEAGRKCASGEGWYTFNVIGITGIIVHEQAKLRMVCLRRQSEPEINQANSKNISKPKVAVVSAVSNTVIPTTSSKASISPSFPQAKYTDSKSVTSPSFPQAKSTDSKSVTSPSFPQLKSSDPKPPTSASLPQTHSTTNSVHSSPSSDVTSKGGLLAKISLFEQKTSSPKGKPKPCIAPKPANPSTPTRNPAAPKGSNAVKSTLPPQKPARSQPVEGEEYSDLALDAGRTGFTSDSAEEHYGDLS